MSACIHCTASTSTAVFRAVSSGNGSRTVRLRSQRRATKRNVIARSISSTKAIERAATASLEREINTQETPPKALTEDIVTSDKEAASDADNINTLLRYPALYDPIRKPRNPVVLCHGLYGFDSWGLDIIPALRIHYWADVLAVLKGVVGIDPIITSVPGTGAVTDRAKALHKHLLKEMSGKSCNLIAHSMGGLDCRYLLTHIRPTEYTPLSLTTLATPHRGSHFMEWCRANIGIGEVAKVAAAAASAATGGHKKSNSSAEQLSKLPYSLKSPLLTRKQQEDAAKARQESKQDSPSSTDSSSSASSDSSRDTPSQRSEVTASKTKGGSSATAAAKTFLNFPGLNIFLGTSLSSYLLDLLDSPAYGNLTPGFLNNDFNPSTPDRDDVRYFSVAAKASKLSVTHPLWLPQLIMDKTEEGEKARDLAERRHRREDWLWGNDGLVPVESAKWGEFLGTIENCDHWALRGGSGISTEIKTKKTVTSPTSGISDSTTTTASSSSTSGSFIPFGWQDVNKAVGKHVDIADMARSAGDMIQPIAAVMPFGDSEKPTSPASSSKTNHNKDATSALSNITSWIVKRIPLSSVGNRSSRSHINPAFPFDEVFTPTLATVSSGPASLTTSTKEEVRPPPARYSASDTARLLFGAGKSSSKSQPQTAAQSTAEAVKQAKFNHEKFYVALCRKLYDEGL